MRSSPVMRFVFWIVALGMVLSGAGAANAQSLTLASPDISEGATIANEQALNGFGCSGGDISPALSWSGAPAGTKSFAVTMFDPDAPTAAASGIGSSSTFQPPRHRFRRAPGT